MGAKGQPKTGGRKKGQVNHTTEDIAAYARVHSRTMVEVLVRIANNAQEPTASQVAAANSVLDRAHGRPASTTLLGGAVNAPIVIHIDAIDAKA